jgi:hypothetical protein
MGPDEYATREELGIMLKFAFAQIQKQGEMIAKLTSLLVDNKALTEQDVAAMLQEFQGSPAAKRFRERLKAVEDFATIHKVARQYLDPQEE